MRQAAGQLTDQPDEDALSASCYRSVFQLAAEHHLRSPGFPPSSTGIDGFPVARAVKFALRELRSGSTAQLEPEHVTVVCFSDPDLRTYETARNAVLNKAVRNTAPNMEVT